MTFLINFILFLITIELILQFTVRHFRKEFQWLITEKDEHPVFNKDKLKAFFDSSFDEELGWVRRPDTQGVEVGKNGKVEYHIDSIGSRVNNKKGVASIVTFGDSYTFCRQVEDSQTWQSYLGNELNEPVLNFGVGNYGVDQALLYYQRSVLPEAKIVILGFVPETICRVQSYWKHYLEFGNTFAFKPKFSLENGKIILHKNLLRKLENFDDLSDLVNLAKKKDVFYERKFKKLQFRASYLFSYLLNFKRNTTLLYLLIKRKIFNKLAINNSLVESAPFSKIMEDNIRDAHLMYKDSHACELLEKIILKFRDEAYKRGHSPLVLVMPQLIDIKIMSKTNTSPYRDFFIALNDRVPVIDMTKYIKNSNIDALYTEDSYGGHFSDAGNKLVADNLLKFLNKSY